MGTELVCFQETLFHFSFEVGVPRGVITDSRGDQSCGSGEAGGAGSAWVSSDENVEPKLSYSMPAEVHANPAWSFRYLAPTLP